MCKCPHPIRTGGCWYFFIAEAWRGLLDPHLSLPSCSTSQLFVYNFALISGALVVLGGAGAYRLWKLPARGGNSFCKAMGSHPGGESSMLICDFSVAWLPCGHRHACSVSRLDGLIGSQVEFQNGALVLLVLNNEGSCFHPPRERVLITVALRVFIALCSI